MINLNIVKKGLIGEIFSKARFGKEPEDYFVSYRDFKTIKEMTLPEFIHESENFQKIPISRITKIRKNNTVLFEKTSTKDE